MPDLNQNDLASRLRNWASEPVGLHGVFISEARAYVNEAANTIEAQAAEITRLRSALTELKEGLRSDGRVWIDRGNGGREAGPHIGAFIDTALNTLEAENAPTS